MANGRCVGKLPDEIVCDEFPPFGGIRDQRGDVSLQEVGGNRHLNAFRRDRLAERFAGSVRYV
jgi:hypothetical protein